MKDNFFPGIRISISRKLGPILVFLFFIFLSCKKDGASGSESDTEYYFEATLSDGRTIKEKAVYPPSGTSTTFMSASIDSVITAGGQTNNCGVPGDCFRWTFIVWAQKEGTYNPFGFLLSPREGPTTYVYYSGNAPFTPLIGNLTMTITKIEKGSQVGRVQGTFSGTVLRHTLPETDTIPVQVSGRFLLPLEQ